MKKRWVRGSLKIGVLLFSLSLFSGYVWYQQNGASRLTEPSEEDEGDVLFSSSKSLSMPIFTNQENSGAIDVLIKEAAGAAERKKQITLMSSSKVTVMALGKFGDVEDGGNAPELTPSHYSTLEEGDTNAKNTLMSSSKSGIISIGKGTIVVNESGDIIISPEKEEEKPAKKKSIRKVMPSSKSAILFDELGKENIGTSTTVKF